MTQIAVDGNEWQHASRRGEMNSLLHEGAATFSPLNHDPSSNQLSQVGSKHRRLASSSAGSSESMPQKILLLEKSAVYSVVPFPEQKLALEDLNPFPASVWSYNLFLGYCLAFWLLYLLLPRGCRKQYCRSTVKRYARRMDSQMPAAGYWMPVHSMQTQSTRSMEEPIAADTRPRSAGGGAAAATDAQETMGGTGPRTPAGGPSSPIRSSSHRRPRANPPSPEHPALKRIPPNKVIAETMARLQQRGIRLVAHGVHCDPKRVWIRLQDEEDEAGTGEACVTWQTEFPRRVPNQSGQVSIVLMRGSLHRIALKNILYIDVGKKTHALQLTRDVPETTCLSLLTQNGSLDLQANSKLERDSLVSCFSMILDDIHEEDWRALYEASPEASLANSSTANQYRFGGGGDMMV